MILLIISNPSPPYHDPHDLLAVYPPPPQVSNMISDEQWRLKTVREREVLQLAKLASQDVEQQMASTTGGKKRVPWKLAGESKVSKF
jgi:hypothetical protein